MSIDTSVGRVEGVRVSIDTSVQVSGQGSSPHQIPPEDTRQTTRLKCARSVLADGTCARSALHILALCPVGCEVSFST